MHIKEQNKIIRVKNLRIFDNYENKTAIDLLIYNENTLIFQEFLLENDNYNDKKENMQARKS